MLWGCWLWKFSNILGKIAFEALLWWPWRGKWDREKLKQFLRCLGLLCFSSWRDHLHVSSWAKQAQVFLPGWPGCKACSRCLVRCALAADEWTGDQKTWVLSPSPSSATTCCRTWGKSLHVPGPQVWDLQSGGRGWSSWPARFTWGFLRLRWEDPGKLLYSQTTSN